MRPPFEISSGRKLASDQGITVKVPVLIVLPPGVVTPIFPLFAPVGTRNVSFESVFTVYEVTATPPTVIFAVWISPVPVRTIGSPTFPLVGEKLMSLGGTLNILLLISVPDPVVTATNPVSPEGTVAVIKVFDSTWKDAAVPLNFTLLAVLNPFPKIPRVLPTAPLGLVNNAKAGRPSLKP
jgi:hypothetical protein